MGMLVPCWVALLLIIIIIQISSSAATSYTVGDAVGWKTPIDDPSFYSKWASQKTFKVGDVLVFNYRIGHSVTEVSKLNYEHCIGTDPISTATEGPVSVTLKSAGDHYFICTFPGHCKFGQKLAITADVDAASPSPSATPSSIHSAVEPAATSPPPSTAPSADESTAATPPSPPKSAGAGGGAGFVLPLLHVFAVLLL